MPAGIFLGFLIGLLFLCFTALATEFRSTKNKVFAITAIILCTFLGGLIGWNYDNYAIVKQVSRYEAAYKTYILSVQNSEISEYDRVAILQSIMDINQEIAETKAYVNSWFSFYITPENKKEVNDLRLIGS